MGEREREWHGRREREKVRDSERVREGNNRQIVRHETSLVEGDERERVCDRDSVTERDRA